MNTSIAFYIDEEYLMAAVEPVKGKFQILDKNGIQQYFLYFNTNNQQSIDYGLDYKAEYYDMKTGYFGDFMDIITDRSFTFNRQGKNTEAIELLNPIIYDVKKAYISAIKNEKADFAMDNTTKIPANIAFADSISPQAKTIIKNYLFNQNFIIQKDNQTVSELFLTYHLEKSQLQSKNKLYIFADTLGKHLLISLFQSDNFQKKNKLNHQIISNFGINPKVYTISKLLVDEINKKENILTEQIAVNREYRRHYVKTPKAAELLKTFQKPKIRIETTFAKDLPKKHVGAIQVATINKQTENHIQNIAEQITNFIQNNKLQPSQIEFIYLIGDTSNSNEIKTFLSNFGISNIKTFSNNDLSILLQQLLYEESEATSFLEAPVVNVPPPPTKKEYKEVTMIDVASLQIGQKIKLNNFDPAPGKGAAVQEFEFMGNNQFKVLSSTRTLNAIIGENVTGLTPVWKPGMQVAFEVTINRQKGIFKTRPIVKILLM